MEKNFAGGRLVVQCLIVLNLVLRYKFPRVQMAYMSTILTRMICHGQPGQSQQQVELDTVHSSLLEQSKGDLFNGSPTCTSATENN